jgi:MFS superfamily sulfate permease-like transporter
MKFEYSREDFFHDFLASLVVFLVALPLCLGIAIASGVPPIVGLLAGVIGGLVVGSITGSPLQVSGPAAGLAVMVFEVVTEHSLAGLGVICVMAGLFQILGYFLKLGNYFKAVSPAVVKGMLSGIGVLIFASQFHVMLDHAPKSSGTQNILTIPQAVLDIFGTGGIQHTYAATIGIITLMVLVGWNFVKDKIKLPVPAPLIAIVLAAVISNMAGLNIKYIEIPDNILAGISIDFGQMWATLNWKMVISGLAIALVATTETLLCVSAVDSIKKGHKSDYNQELLAQGIGNTLAGFIGAMPITGVIVRSSANVEFGGRTKGATIMHGLWLVFFLFIASQLLEFIPTAALAAILVYTGYRLVDVRVAKKFAEFGRSEVFIYVATIVAIVTINLLYGVLIGYALSLLQLLYRLNHFELNVIKQDGKTKIEAHGVLTFLSLPKISEAVDRIISKDSHTDDKATLCLNNVRYMDSASKDYIDQLKNNNSDDIHFAT